MTVNDAITKLKVMLGASEETVVKMNFAEATLVDGSEVYTEGELEPGAILFVRAGEGADQDPFAPAGVHETTNGLLVTVGENGEIESVEEKGAEMTPEQEQETFEVEDVTEEELEEEDKKVEMSADEMLAAIAELIKGYQDEISEVKEEMSTLTERFNVIADQPAGKKVRNTFSENAATSKSTSEARLEKLIQIRNRK